MKTLLLAASALVALAAGSANADTISFAGYHTALNAGETLITNFADPALTPSGYTLTGNGAFLTGNSGYGAAPALSILARDPGQYLSIEGGQVETLATPLLSEISFYIGSLDDYNSVTFTFKGGKTETLGGDDLVHLAPIATDHGDQQSIRSNGRVTFTFDTPITDVAFGSSGNSFEIADIAAIAPAKGGGDLNFPSPAPEPASWAMMLVGFAGLGGVLRGARRGKSLAVAV